MVTSTTMFFLISECSLSEYRKLNFDKGLFAHYIIFLLPAGKRVIVGTLSLLLLGFYYLELKIGVLECTCLNPSSSLLYKFNILDQEINLKFPPKIM